MPRISRRPRRIAGCGSNAPGLSLSLIDVSSIVGLLGNVLWFIFAGIWLAIGHLLSALACFITIIGIPFGLQHLKLAGIALAPIGKTIVMQVTGADVIHAWAMPAFGVMQSGVPGRLGQLWFKADREGVYFGQCTTLCGKDHAYMPITVKVVSQAAYDVWLAGAKAGNFQLASN